VKYSSIKKNRTTSDKEKLPVAARYNEPHTKPRKRRRLDSGIGW
jgi:hypothetical protein